ncbi:hypothetical protein AB0L65_16745 [Nonomuraea sp. NPDC052116]|uniref:hypothetical protein n=1 Tax=Nonomuraea sp. NPDC052116 TaxID=3155665 RepID=UPI0034257046
MTRSRVHLRRPRHGGDDPKPFGREHLPERGGEERIAIVDQEPQLGDALPQVAGLLDRPRPGRTRGHPTQMQPPSAVLDDDQHIQPFEQYRLDHQEVARVDRVGLSGQELPPGRPSPARRRIDAGGVQDLPDTVEAAI